MGLAHLIILAIFFHELGRNDQEFLFSARCDPNPVLRISAGEPVP
jgi:hypothetical protein